MKVSLLEYAKIHNLKHSTVRSYVARGQLTVIGKDHRYTYVDSEEIPPIKSYVLKFGNQESLLNIFRQMKSRCYNKKNPRYKNYGGRGIRICEEWLTDRSEFIKWALANGYKTGLTIDRINTDEGYSPGNCQWLTRSENSKKMIRERKAKR